MNYIKSKYTYNNKLLLSIIVITLLNILTLKTFFFSSLREVIIFSISLILLMIYYTKINKKITVFKFEPMWYLFIIYFLLNMLYHSTYKNLYLLDVFIFIFILGLIILLKIDYNYYIISLKIIFVFSLVYSLSAIFQYINSDLYSKIILPLFEHSQKEEVLRLYNYGYYTGFTEQTAFLAGYLVFGIGVIITLYRTALISSKWKCLFVLSTPILLYALMLTGKRAHLLFMVVSAILTLIVTSVIKKNFNKLVKLTGSIVMIIILSIVSLPKLLMNNNFFINNRLLHRISTSIEGFISGEDITSGRVDLYAYSIELFKESPILGIGWREFSEFSVGMINVDTGSHPHNIYLQLLTELGLLGFVIFLIPVVYIYFITIKSLKYISDNSSHIIWEPMIKFSLYIQTFFLLYGLTGNLLTDHLFILIYFFSITMVLSFKKYLISFYDVNKVVIGI